MGNFTFKCVIGFINIYNSRNVNSVVIQHLLTLTFTNINTVGRVALWLTTSARKPKVSGSSPAASYVQR